MTSTQCNADKHNLVKGEWYRFKGRTYSVQYVCRLPIGGDYLFQHDDGKTWAMCHDLAEELEPIPRTITVELPKPGFVSGEGYTHSLVVGFATKEEARIALAALRKAGEQ